MKEFQIHFFNTIWSDAILLSKKGEYALIDTASAFYYPDLKWYFKKCHIKRFAFIILTHFHSDHYGNMAKILNDYQVDTIYLKHYYGIDGQSSNGSNSNDEIWEHELNEYQKIIDLATLKKVKIIYLDECQNDLEIIDFQGVNLELVDLKNRLFATYHNQESEFFQEKRFSENFNSIGVFINYLNNAIFLGADMTDSKTTIEGFSYLSEKEVKAFYDRHNISHVDLYKSCHHGGSGTNPKELLALINAKYIVITNTNRWLDGYTTIPDALAINKKTKILKCDYYLYRFTISKKIKYHKFRRKSLFLKLKKN